MEPLSIHRRVVSQANMKAAAAAASKVAQTSDSAISSPHKTALGLSQQSRQVGGVNSKQKGIINVDGIEKETKKKTKVIEIETKEEKVQRGIHDAQPELDSKLKVCREQTVSRENNLCNNNNSKNQTTIEECLPAKKLAIEIKDKLSNQSTGEESELKHLITINSENFYETQHKTGVKEEKKTGSRFLNSLIEGRKSWFKERTIIVDIKNSNSNSNGNSNSDRKKGIIDKGDLIKNKVSCKEKFEIIKYLEDEEQFVDSLNQINQLNKIKKFDNNNNNSNNKLLNDRKSNNSTKLASNSSNQTNNKTLSANNNNNNNINNYIKNKQANNIVEGGKIVSVEEEKSDKNRNLRIDEENISKSKDKEQQELTIDNNTPDKNQDTDNNTTSNIESFIKGRKKAEDRQQVGEVTSAQGSKGKTPPTFGGTPYKVSRLPYYSYHGRARNVDLITAADRESRLKNNKQQVGSFKYGNQSDSSNSFDSSEPKSPLSNISSTSPTSSGDNSGKVPTLSRTSGYRDSHQINDLNEETPTKNYHHRNNIENSKINTNHETENNINSNRITNKNRRGFSNISNLFPEQQMNNYYSNKAEQLRERNRQLRFNSEERLERISDRRRQQQLQQQHWNSLSNLNYQTSRGKSRLALSPLQRQNSISNNTNSHQYSRPNRSMNSLNTSPYSENNHQQQQQQQQQQSTMRRQNSSSAYGSRAKQRGSSYQGRSMSAAPNYASKHHRSPSASSLYYGSAGMSPYGPPPIDPDCPVHGYSPPVNQMHSKSSQNLAASDADLLYEPYNAFYDRPTAAIHNQASGSLYSPTSPPLIDRQPPIGSVAAKGGRLLTAANGNPNAYYNNASRFSMYHSPVNGYDGGVRSTLAPPNEQLRRILGYQPHTRPIYLHPQWAYSRPFIHLQGATTRSSPGSPLDRDDDDDEDGMGEIRPRFEPYNQLHDTQAIRAVDFHPSGEVYAVGSNSRALRICAYPADYELRHFSQDHVTTAPRILFKFLQVHRGSIYCVSFNSSGQLLATGSNDQTVHIVKYNSITHSPDGDEYRLTMHDGTVRDLCFIDESTGSGSSLLLSAGGGDNKIYVTDCDTITPFQSMAGHTQMIMALHHWGGSNFVSASYDRTIRFWDLRTRACTSIISAPPSFNTGTGGGATSGGGGTTTSASAKSWGGPGAPVCAVKVDPTGRLLASGHNDSTCMLYDIRGARVIQAFKPHDDEIRTVSFSPKSYYLLTGGYDGRIMLTDIQGDLTQQLPSCCVAESDDKIVQSKWHPSDFTFVTTSADKTATLWAMPTE